MPKFKLFIVIALIVLTLIPSINLEASENPDPETTLIRIVSPLVDSNNFNE